MSSGSILSIFNKDSDERLYLKNENFNDLEFSDFTISSRIKHSIGSSDGECENYR